MDKLILTGADGFIGRYYQQLNAKDLICWRTKDGIDVTDSDTFPKNVHDASILVHLAGVSHHKTPDKDYLYNVNVIGTENLVKWAERNGIEKIVYASTHVYGKPIYLPIDEKHPIQLHTDYAKSKYLGEEHVKSFKGSSIILRFANVYGPGQITKTLIPTILTQLKSGEIKLRNKLTKRDFIYVEDAIRAIQLSVENKTFQKNNLVLNIGSGKSHSVQEVLNFVLENWGSSVNVRYKEDKICSKEIADCYFSYNAAKEAIGWNPEVSLKEGIRKTMEWFKCQIEN